LQEPTGASTTDFEPSIGGVSCSSATDCFAVGSYYDQAGYLQAMSVHYNGTSWSQAVELTLPSDVGTATHATLNGISCTSDQCVSVGSYRDTGGHTQAMYASEGSGTWAQAVKVTSPSMSATDPSAVLKAVACPSDGNCVAVGSYSDNTMPNSYEQAMSATEASGTWGQAVELAPPSPARAGSFGPNGQLRAVTCTSANNCGASGGYVDANGGDQGMLDTLTGGSWGTALESPLPNNATTTARAQGAFLGGVACLTASACTY